MRWHLDSAPGYLTSTKHSLSSGTFQPRGDSMLLTIRDESATGNVTNELTLDVLAETITVRELIRSRVYQEVQDYNLRQRTNAGTTFRGLVTPSDAERTLNGVKL